MVSSKTRVCAALLRGAALLACVLVTFACSDGDGDDDGGGTGGAGGSGGSSGAGGSGGSGAGSGATFSCDTPAKFACIELQVPPGGVQAATDQCVDNDGTPGTACPGGAIAECEGAPHYFYYTGFDAIDQAEQTCTGLGGTWVVH